MPNLIDKYLQFVVEGKKKYGEQTIVCLECGHFYEVYDMAPPEQSAHLRRCQEMGLMVTRKNKADPNSAYMAGIPSHSVRRFNKLLLQHNYTIIFVNQEGETPNITRRITKVLSPGCNLSEEVHESTDAGQSVLMALLVEEDEDGECFAHLATFDANCGKTQLQTVNCDADVTTTEMMFTTLQDMLHTCLFHELCVHYKSPRPDFADKIHTFTQFWKDRGKQIHEFDVGVHQMDHMFQRSFQQQFLERMFKHHASGFCSIWESLHLEFTEPSCVAVLVMLLHWIRMHDERLVTSLQVPQSHQPSVVHRNDTHTQPGHSTVNGFNELYAKLNVFDDKQSTLTNNTRSLFSLLNKTRTKMGERLLRDRLIHVATDAPTMNARLNLVSALLNENQHPNDMYLFLNHTLKCIDLERVYRRFSVGNLQPHDIPRVLQSQQNVLDVARHIASLPTDHPLAMLLPDDSVLQGFEQYHTHLKSLFDEDKCASINMANLHTTLFRTGTYPDIDKAVAHFEKQTDAMHILSNALMARVPNIKLPKHTTTWINVKKNDKEGYWLDVTKARFLRLQAVLDAITEEDKAQFAEDTDYLWTIDDLAFDTKNKSNVKISGAKMSNLSHVVQHAQLQLIQLVKDTYTKLLQDLHATHYTQSVQPLIECTAQLDVAFSSAKTASLYGYSRPTIVVNKPSSIEATALRHPLIERMLVQSNCTTPYVPNDVCLSHDSCWLLYGVNSVGKSSLLKSIAISVLMAQSGLFVPAKAFTLSPYHKIFARTGNDDNIHMAHSSFVKEITEVKNIVENADERSLVIADELCASTELDSAVNIVGALLTFLNDCKATYAFATHLFALQDHSYVQELLHPNGSLRNLHLQVRFDNKKLWFDRTLTDGLPTNRTYGVLVADKVIQNTAFTSLLAQVPTHTQPTARTAHARYTQQPLYTHQSAHTQCTQQFSTPSHNTASQHISQTYLHHTNTTYPVDPTYPTHTTTQHQPPPTHPFVCPDSIYARPLPIYSQRKVPTSRYNRSHWNEECAVCRYRPMTKQHMPLDTHHIVEQRLADRRTGRIDERFHKNERHNLVTLCKECHQQIDTGELVVEGYVSTSDGPELVWYRNQSLRDTRTMDNNNVTNNI